MALWSRVQQLEERRTPPNEAPERPSAGCLATEASYGKEALALCRAEHPELAFPDIRLLELDGIGGCCEVHNDPAISIMAGVALTGDGRETEIY